MTSRLSNRDRGLVRTASAAPRGFTLIELIAAMIASTVLVASLAATVLISSRLLETPPADDELWQNRLVADRVASDLRFATSVDDTLASGFEVTRVNTQSGTTESLTYQSSAQGFTRKIDSGPPVVLDSDSPTQTLQVDGYSAPTTPPSDAYVRVRSKTTAFTTIAAGVMQIDIPPGCKTGDTLLLAVSAKSPSSLSVSGSGWQLLHLQSLGDLRLATLIHTYDSAWPSSVNISVSPDSAIAAAMVAIEHPHPSAPIAWSGTTGGFAFQGVPLSHPQPLETSGFEPRHLNVQVFAAELDPWIDGALGMAGFTDVAQATAGEGNVSLENTIAIAVRNGATPTQSVTPRLIHQDWGLWLQVGIRVESQP